QAGDHVFLPIWWERVQRQRPRIKARIPAMAGPAPAMFGLQQIINFDWRLAIGDMELTEEEFRALLEQKKRILRFRGQWIQLDPSSLNEIQRAMQQLKKKKGLSLRDILEMHLLEGEGRLDWTEEAQADDLGTMEVELNSQLRGMIESL